MLLPHVKSFFRSQDIYNFGLLTFWFVGKRLDKKATVNFKIYDVAAWTANNYNAHIGQCIKN